MSKGHYTEQDLREITDTEVNDQYQLIEAEYIRRKHREQRGRDLDAFLRRNRELEGDKFVDGQSWYEPDEVWAAYPMGSIIQHDGDYYESIRHANLQHPSAENWWKKLGKEKPASLKPKAETVEETEAGEHE